MLDLPGEIWKVVPNYGGRYYISSFGRLKNRHGVIKKQHINRYGYPVSTLYDGSGYSYPTIHKIVATVFLTGFSNDRNEVDHLDGNRLNNHCDNLRWATRKENMNNPNTKKALSKRKGPNKGKFGSLHPRSKAIYSIDENGNKVYYGSVREASRAGFSFRLIESCLHSDEKKHKGYYWRYA